LSGHVGRIGGRQVVAVLALGGGLLLGPLLPAQAADDSGAAAGDGGPASTAPGPAHDHASPAAVLPDGEHRAALTVVPPGR
jgi:hypothetical protein